MILRLHRAIPVTAVTFLCLLVAAGLRSAPSVMMMPLQLHFGWDRATVSLTSAVGIFLYGLVGPFAAALMLSLGIRRTMLGGLALMALGTLLSRFMTESWHYLLTWGVISVWAAGPSPMSWVPPSPTAGSPKGRVWSWACSPPPPPPEH
jgi:fucose permease